MRVHVRRKAKSVRLRYAWNNPGTVIDRSGHVVSTKQECWRLNEVTRPVIVNWNGIESASDIKDSMKAYLAHVIESNAPQTTHGTFKYLRQFISLAEPLRSVRALTYPVLEKALAKFRACGAEENFRAVQGWYRWAVAQDLPGFCEDILMRLDQIKISSHLIGQAVMSRDPAKGLSAPTSDCTAPVVLKVHQQRGI